MVALAASAGDAGSPGCVHSYRESLESGETTAID